MEDRRPMVTERHKKWLDEQIEESKTLKLFRELTEDSACKPLYRFGSRGHDKFGKTYERRLSDEL
jgi:hypothetical protein